MLYLVIFFNYVFFVVIVVWEGIVELVGIGVWGCCVCIWGLFSLWKINGRVSIGL